MLQLSCYSFACLYIAECALASVKPCFTYDSPLGQGTTGLVSKYLGAQGRRQKTVFFNFGNSIFSLIEIMVIYYGGSIIMVDT